LRERDFARLLDGFEPFLCAEFAAGWVGSGGARVLEGQMFVTLSVIIVSRWFSLG